jgi:hypothetical protein
MSIYRVIDTDEGNEVYRGTLGQCNAWAERHNLKVIANGGDVCFVVERVEEE